IWLLDHHTAKIGYKMRSDLGDWLRHHLKKGVSEQGSAAQENLDLCGLSVTPLRGQWENQCALQLSIRAHVLKKEPDTVLVLQADIDNTNKLLQLARTTIEKGNATPGILDALASLECTHAKLAAQAETLYSSLNVHNQFSELSHVSLDFVRTLLMARDLKINIWKRAVGSFFEWDRLDCAVGGKDKPLGEFHRELVLLLTRR
ncbi:hypothetical protein SCLCIDRAFT_134308, partial [Scleroderma citrinum Foug A]